MHEASKKIFPNGQEVSVNYLNKVENFILKQKDKISFENFISCLWFLENLGVDKIIKEHCHKLPEIAMRLEKSGINNSIIINDHTTLTYHQLKLL